MTWKKCGITPIFKRMIVLGIDPGIARCGWGVVEKQGQVFRSLGYGCIETAAGMEESERLRLVHDGVIEVIRRYKIDKIGLEKLFFSKNAKTAFQVGQARGVILLALRGCGVDVVEISPNEVKSAVAGYGAADKKQMQEMVRLSLKLAQKPEPDDAADALAVAITVAALHRA